MDVMTCGAARYGLCSEPGLVLRCSLIVVKQRGCSKFRNENAPGVFEKNLSTGRHSISHTGLNKIMYVLCLAQGFPQMSTLPFNSRTLRASFHQHTSGYGVVNPFLKSEHLGRAQPCEVHTWLLPMTIYLLGQKRSQASYVTGSS